MASLQYWRDGVDVDIDFALVSLWSGEIDAANGHERRIGGRSGRFEPDDDANKCLVGNIVLVFCTFHLGRLFQDAGIGVGEGDDGGLDRVHEGFLFGSVFDRAVEEAG